VSDAAAVPPSFWRAIGLTLEATVRNVRTCLMLVAAYAVLNGLSNAIGSTLSVEIDPLRASGSELIALSAAAIAGFATFLLVYIFVYPPTLGALSLVGSAAETGDVLETHGIIRRVFDRALEVIGTFVLTILILAVAPITIGLIAVLVGLVAGAEAGVGALLFTLIVVVVPSVYVLVRLSLAVPAVVLEGLSPIGALRRSWDLVGGNWWWVFGVMVVVGLIGGLIGNVASTVVSLGHTGIFTVGRQVSSNFALSALGTMVGTAIYGALFGVATGVIYGARAQAKPPAELALPDAPAPDAEAPEPPAPDASDAGVPPSRGSGVSDIAE